MKSPAFQIYPADFLADKNTLVMSAAEVGAYWLLLCVCWRENGLPDDLEELALVARTPVKQFQSSWEKRIQRCFVKREDGKWTHNRLQRERDKQAENREKRKEAGSKGAANRWQTDSNAITETSQGHASANGKPMANDSLSVFSLPSSSSSSKRGGAPATSKRRRKPKPQAVESSVPDLFPVTDEMRAWAAERVPGIDVDSQTERFLNRAKAKGITAVDWMATWRNWMLKALEFKTRDEPAPVPLHPSAWNT